MLDEQAVISNVGEVTRDFHEYFSDPLTTDVIINPNQQAFVSYANGKKVSLGKYDARRTWTIIATIATALERTITELNPTVLGRIPGTPHRITMSIPPTTKGPMVAIRCHGKEVRPLASYVAQGVITAEQFHQLQEDIQERKNIIVTGATGSGKTTFLNALLAETQRMTPHDRVVTIEEESEELLCPLEDTTSLYTCESREMQELVQFALRSQPTRIVIGEVRTASAWQLVKAWRTGHRGGLTTIHADYGVNDAIQRMRDMVSEARMTVSAQSLKKLMHVIVHLRCEQGRRTYERFETTKGITP